MRKNRSSGSLAATWRSSEDDLPRLEAVASGAEKDAAMEGDALPLGGGRLLLVTNRLPVSAERTEGPSEPGSSGSLASMQREAGGVGSGAGGAPREGGVLGGEAPGLGCRVSSGVSVGTEGGEGQGWVLRPSAGGLVSALQGTTHGAIEQRWIGWPGVATGDFKSKADMNDLRTTLERSGFCPVFLDSRTFDLYYNGYCNSVLWQLFHYVMLQQETELGEKMHHEEQWEAYRRANQLFAAAVLAEYRPGDTVWCHDYHLMLLPAILKQAHPEMRVGWFLHTPFPSSEICRVLPERNEILAGVLEADLVGFHTYDYARHFVSACSRILGMEGTTDGVFNMQTGAATRVAVFPIGIDPIRFSSALYTAEVQARVEELKMLFRGRKVMLGVDRLDMVKGIPQKLLAYEKFLSDNPQWRDKVLLVQVAVPTRKQVPEYQKLASSVHEMVGRINGKFGSLTGVPIHHLDRSLSFPELVALYACTDVCLVSSLRDGMNLVSYEYVACQSQKDVPGVLVLSEFAGAAQSLGAGAVLVNPWNTSDVSEAIAAAVSMSQREKRERHQQNFGHVVTHTAQSWAETFLSELNDTQIEAELLNSKIPPAFPLDKVAGWFAGSGKRMLVLGFNHTLTQKSTSNPVSHKLRFDQLKHASQLNPECKRHIEHLSKDPANIVVVFSGSMRHSLEKKFIGMNVWLAAENGFFLRPPIVGRPSRNEDWIPMHEEASLQWMSSVELVYEYFSERTPSSYVDVRDTSLVWNYGFADVDFGRLQAREMLQHLWTGPISQQQVDIIQGAKSVEARPVGVTKGKMMEQIFAYILEQQVQPIDFVFCAGHFLKRDEDIFNFLCHEREDRDSTASLLGSGDEMSSPRRDAPLSEDMSPSLRHLSLASDFGGHARSPGNSFRLHSKDLSHQWSLLRGRGPPRHFVTCTVGRKRSLAMYHLQNSDGVAEVLQAFCEGAAASPAPAGDENPLAAT